MLILPDSQYRQRLSMVLTESEIFSLYKFLADTKRDCLYWPKVAEELRSELRYMLIEVKEFNAYQQQGGKP